MHGQSVALDNVAVEFFAAERVVKSLGPVSIAFRRGEVVGLLGPSGCGKTTLLRATAGLVEKKDLRNGVALSGKVHLPAGIRLAMMFQETVLIPQLSVIDNVLIPFLAQPNGPQDDVYRSAIDLLDRMGLSDETYKFPDILSGGMRTRVGLARALITRPSLLLLDEPFNGLDIGMREKCYHHISELAAGATIVLVTHNLDEAHRLCDRVIVFSSGARVVREILGRGSFENFRKQVVKAFGV